MLGVTADASPDVVRGAYRRLVRRHHPDVAGESRDAVRRTAELNQAYALLLRLDDEAGAAGERIGASSPGPGAAPSSFDVAVDADGFVPVEAATLDVFNRLCEAADVIGSLSYVDRANTILETMITTEGGPTCSLMVTLEPRGSETLAYCTLESLDARPGPPIEQVVAALTHALDRLA